MAPVARKAHLLGQHRDRVSQAGGRRHGQFRPVRLAALVVAVLVEVHEDRRPGERGRLVDATVQLPGAGRHLPVDALERVAQDVLPHARGARGVFVQPVLKPHFADRSFRF